MCFLLQRAQLHFKVIQITIEVLSTLQKWSKEISWKTEEIIGSDFSTYTEQLKLLKKRKKQKVKISNDNFIWLFTITPDL